eukprot:TRINITY_DN6301_c0_g3_i2.p1 TRINITY_DN6301_c0_g3~~TRINITY_DN6301_c0_g3_i2.p1  ORF type:complete len:209 (-),score=45.12 TRINITY_DN6301_c0_g3_i2:61-627(-)
MCIRDRRQAAIERMKNEYKEKFEEAKAEKMVTIFARAFPSWANTGIATLRTNVKEWVGTTTQPMVPPFKAIFRLNHNLGISIGLVETYMENTIKHDIFNCPCHERGYFCYFIKDEAVYAKNKESKVLVKHSNPRIGVKVEIEVNAQMKCIYYFDGKKECEFDLPPNFKPHLYAEVYGAGPEVELLGII